MFRKTIGKIGIAIVLLILGCDTYPPSEPFSMLEVPGRYIASFGETTDYIDLASDSTFIHTYVSGSGNEYLDSGGWEITERSTKGYFNIRLKGYKRRYPTAPMGDYDPDGQVDSIGGPDSFTFKKQRGKLRIIIHPMRVMYYEKEE